MFVSTSGQFKAALKDIVLEGLAPDGSLYMPAKVPQLSPLFFENLPKLTFQEISFEIALALLGYSIPQTELKQIIEKSLDFEIPLKQLSENFYSLELFHGPTLSFKDVGACFMAHLIDYLFQDSQKKINILAATSGDTGSAIAHSFSKISSVTVWVLYPKGQVSEIQQKQLTTFQENLNAVEVDGSFDDCQSLVKQALNDEDLKKKFILTSANSINIARLIPQSFYYFYAYSRLNASKNKTVISVPSGNLGNLTAGLLAKRMGLPVKQFIAANNTNDSFSKYLKTATFQPQKSQPTLSNAMDVGNPSNFSRILSLYAQMHIDIIKDIWGSSYTDDQTQQAICEIYQTFNYIADPHGAVAYLGLKEYQAQFNDNRGIFLETAHPAKYASTIEPLIHTEILIPERLQKAISKQKKPIPLSNNFSELKALFYSKLS